MQGQAPAKEGGEASRRQSKRTGRGSRGVMGWEGREEPFDESSAQASTEEWARRGLRVQSHYSLALVFLPF